MDLEAQVFNPLADIKQYNTSFTMSQLLKFCEKKGLPTTRAMVQNYMRLKLLPPSVNSRFYTHNHLAALVIIEQLKPVYSYDEIKAIMKPFLVEDGLPLEIYEEMMKQREAAMVEWNARIAPLLASPLAASVFTGDVRFLP